MADLDVVPTRTSVQFDSSTGRNATLMGASDSAAGAMTADHVRMLLEVYAWHRAWKVAGGPSTPPDFAAYASRAETEAMLRRALEDIGGSAAASDMARELAAAGARIAGLERQLAAMQAQPAAPARPLNEPSASPVARPALPVAVQQRLAQPAPAPERQAVVARAAPPPAAQANAPLPAAAYLQPPARQPDLDRIEAEALAEIAIAAEQRQSRMPVEAGNVLIMHATQQAIELRTARTVAEIERVRAEILAYIAAA